MLLEYERPLLEDDMSAHLNLFEQVRRGEISSEDAAEQVMAAREAAERPEKPAWMPKGLFLAGLFLVAVLLPSVTRRR